MKRSSGLRLFLLFILLGLQPIAHADSTRSEISSRTSEAGNTYIAGRELRIVSPVPSDLLAAGGRVDIESRVGGDGAIAGGVVDIRAPVMQDLRVAGGTVNIDKDVGGELVAAGGAVRLNKSASVAGSAWLAGRDVVVDGTVDKDARIYGNTITISGKINGDAQFYGQEIRLQPGARIAGNLHYSSPNVLASDNSAQVAGNVTREPAPEGWERSQESRASGIWFAVLFMLSMMVLGALLYLVFPGAVRGATRTLRQYPLRSLLVGLALIFSAPPLAILLMITVVGIPVGFTLLLLYPLALLLGYLAAAFFVGRQVATVMRQPEPLGFKRQMLFLALALLVLGVLAAVPFLGFLILVTAVVLGIGAWAVWAYLQYHSRGTSAA